MFAGAQIVTTKLVHQSNRKEMLTAQSEERTAQDLMDLVQPIPRSQASIVVETRTEKIERKALAQERRQERLVEQQKIAQHMENLMEKVLRETPLSKKEESNLRHRIKAIMTKVNRDPNRSDGSSRHRSLIEPSSSSSQARSQVVQTDNQPSRPVNQGAFLLWHEKNIQ